MKEFLKQVGDLSIEYMTVTRRPINDNISKMMTLINTIANHKSKENNVDKLFHLFFVITINGTHWRVEKNEQLNMTQYEIDPRDESIPINNIPFGMTINKMLTNAINKCGEKRIFKYSAFNQSGGGNCQAFVIDMLDSSNILISDTSRQFIVQPIIDLVPHWTQRLSQTITDLASATKTLIA